MFTILSFWTNVSQAQYLTQEIQQAVQELQAFAYGVVNVNSTVVFKHFECLKDLKVLPLGLFLS